MERENALSCSSHRRGQLLLAIQPNWAHKSDADSQRYVQWADEFADSLEGDLEGSYPNYADARLDVRTCWDQATVERLTEVKKRSDPVGLFAPPF